MTSNVSYKDQYRRRVSDADASWQRLIDREIHEQTWDKPSHTPEEPVNLNVTFALQCAYGADRCRSEVLLKRAVKYGDGILELDLCRATPVSKAGYPGNVGAIVRGRAYARWLLGGPLDRAELRQAAEHLVTWCLTKANDRRRFSDSLTMDVYVGGVRAALVAWDLDYARELLATRHALRWHHGRQRELWTSLVQRYPDIDQELRDEIEDLFDDVRDPDFEEVIDGMETFITQDWVRFETGIIRQMVLINDSPLDPIDPQIVIKAVSR